MLLRLVTILMLLIFSLPVWAQRVSCKCDSAIAGGFQLDCERKSLRDGASLRYQFNCDSIWLTLQNRNGRKHVLYSIPTRLYNYHERVGYVFYKEFQKGLLFRKDCVAPTGCNFFMVDKQSGRTLETFGDRFIDCPGTERLRSFLIYLSYAPYPNLKLVLYNPDDGKRIKLPLRKSDFSQADAESQIDSINIRGKILTLTYTLDEGGASKKVQFDLRKYGG